MLGVLCVDDIGLLGRDQEELKVMLGGGVCNDVEV